jgi:hypothetical protein
MLVHLNAVCFSMFSTAGDTWGYCSTAWNAGKG